MKTNPMSKSIPEFADKGVPFPVASPVIGVGMQKALITQVGATPFSVVLADHGLQDMADADYVVLVGGETAAPVMVDESTKTATGFDVLDGANDEVLNILIVGRVKGMIDSNGSL